MTSNEDARRARAGINHRSQQADGRQHTSQLRIRNGRPPSAEIVAGFCALSDAQMYEISRDLDAVRGAVNDALTMLAGTDDRLLRDQVRAAWVGLAELRAHLGELAAGFVAARDALQGNRDG